MAAIIHLGTQGVETEVFSNAAINLKSISSLHLSTNLSMLPTAMTEWFYGKDNAQHGPVSEQDIHTLVSSGQLDANTIVWREGMTDWIPMKDVPALQAIASSISGNLTQTQPSPYASTPSQPYPMAPHTDGLSIASLVCGILAVMTCYFGGLFGLPAVLCGHISLKKIKTSETPIGGRGMAIAGLITGYIGIAMTIAAIGLFAIGIAGGLTAAP